MQPSPRSQFHGKNEKVTALAGDRVEIAADILDAENAIVEEHAMHRLPERMIVLPVAAAGPLLVFLGEMRMQRTIAMRADRGRERVIVGLRVVADHLDLLLDEPVAGGRHEAGALAEIIFAVAIS